MLLSWRILSKNIRSDAFGDQHKKDKLKYLVTEKAYLLRFLNRDLLERNQLWLIYLSLSTHFYLQTY